MHAFTELAAQNRNKDAQQLPLDLMLRLHLFSLETANKCHLHRSHAQCLFIVPLMLAVRCLSAKTESAASYFLAADMEVH